MDVDFDRRRSKPQFECIPDSHLKFTLGVLDPLSVASFRVSSVAIHAVHSPIYGRRRRLVKLIRI